MEGMGKSLIVIGLLLIVIGVAIAFGPRIPFIGKLPGDIYIKKDSFTFYFPLATSVLISVIITFVMYLFRK
ncbi:MAG: hypothetical protein HW382_994 [Deltaproteobacteria bacterium]|nr:hypothetical protein [Deltaproteobacteria bacterium]